MINKIEQKIEKEPKDKKQLIISIIVIILVIVLFAVFMTFDFNKESEDKTLTSQERMRLLEESLRDGPKISSEERLQLLQESRLSSSLTPQERLELLNNN